jgi:beta-fructofuranosidase
LGGSLEGTRIVATQGRALSFEVSVSDGYLSVRLPQDDGKIRYQAAFASATDLRIIYDRGILEVFGDNGAIWGTRRSYTNITPNRIEVTSAAQVTLSERRAVQRT